MPLLTRTFLKTATVCLPLALMLGILLALGVTNGLFPVYSFASFRLVDTIDLWCLVCARVAALSFAGIFLRRVASRPKRDFYTPVWYLFPLHMEFLLVGWLIQLAMGVAFWVIPRFSNGPSRGPVGLVWFSFALLNAGILITALQFWFPVVVLIGRIAEVGAGILFVVGSWRRIKSHGVM